MADQVIFTIVAAEGGNSKIRVIKINDLFTGKEYLWSSLTGGNGWNDQILPSVTIGPGLLKITAMIVNEGQYGRIMASLVRQPDAEWPSGLQLALIDEHVNANTQLDITATTDMPAYNISIKVFTSELA
jgi:hypothetical protein